MQGREAIVGKIIADAEEKAEKLRADAAQRAEAAAAAAERAAQERLAEGRRALGREAEEIVARRETVAALDTRKEMLAAKRGIIEEVLSSALKTACAFKKEKYLAVLGDLLARYAEEDDAVTLASSAPVGEKELSGLKAFSEKKLRFAGKEDFEGGVRLENAVCVKDLSFRALLEAARSGLEREIADALFPAEK